MEERTVEIVEYWNKKEKVYEFMLGTEFEKKKRGFPYEVIRKDTSPPWTIFGEDLRKAEWIASRTYIDRELINKPLNK